MRIAIIGAGPAGIFTARLLENFAGAITLFEQNSKLGAKLRLTGGGRMNLANQNFSVREFVSSEPNLLRKLFRVPHFQRGEEIYAALAFTLAWEDDRAFPRNFSAEHEVERLAENLRKQPNLTLRLGTEIQNIRKEGSQFVLTSINSEGDTAPCRLRFDAVVLTSGGMLRLHTSKNSAQEIYALPIQLGHTLTEIAPALSPLVMKNFPLAEFAGISFSARLTDLKNKKAVMGDVLLTHTGLSGPIALDFSLLLAGDEMKLNFLPEKTEAEFVTEFQALRQGRHTLKNFLRGLLPKRLADWHLAELKIPETQIIAELGKVESQTLQKNLFHFVFRDVKKMDYAHAWTTRGGVSLREVNVATLASRLHENLFFAGEILDVTGFCGGYNLTFAAVSAKIVSEGILKKEK